MKKLSSFSLKNIALLFMTVDHINTSFGNLLHRPGWASWLGRFVAPLFSYFLMEGFNYSKNRKKYLSRLFFMSLVMTAINIVKNILTGSYINPYSKQFSFERLINGNNIFMTLFLILSLFILLDKVIHQKEKKWLFLIVLVIPLILISEDGLYLFPIALACYFFNNDAKKVSMSIAIWSLLLFIKSLVGFYSGINETQSFYQFLTFSNEFMMITVIPFILLYNGKRGGNGQKWEKYLFYVYYPIHLIIIYFLRALFKL